MSGAILSDVGGTTARTFVHETEPRRPFGRRRRGPDTGSGVDRDVADMRRRIGGVRPAPLQAPLPWALGGALVAGLSGLLWMDAFQVATKLAWELARAL
jgi:hypothetical protein